MADVFTSPIVRRGIGAIPRSGWRLSDAYRAFDAEVRFQVEDIRTEESRRSAAAVTVLRGMLKPNQCPASVARSAPAHAAGRDHGLQRGRAPHTSTARFAPVELTTEPQIAPAC
ncbi:MAG: hypothetical protein R3A10_01290 [Caldilineaceae bacterium]